MHIDILHTTFKSRFSKKKNNHFIEMLKTTVELFYINSMHIYL